MFKLKQVNPGAPHLQDRVYDVGGVAPALSSEHYGQGRLIAIKNATKNGSLKIENGGGDEHSIPRKQDAQRACG